MQKINSSWGWAGCFESLPYPLNVQDVTPTSSNKDSYYVPLFAPDEPANGIYNGANYYLTQPNSYDGIVNSYINDSTSDPNCTTATTEQAAEVQACKYVKPTVPSPNGFSFGPNFGCNAQPLIRLTNDQSALQSEINAMAPNGQTNIHEGMIWGWRTVSPNSVLGDGQPYNTKNLQKVVVLMTDGMNTFGVNNGWNTMNQSYYSAYGYVRNGDGSSINPRLPPGNANPTSEGQARAAMDELTLEACNNAKAAGVSIYTVGFSVPSDPIDPQGINLLQSCASSPGQYYAANDSGGLINAFQSIAVSIGALRLSH